MCNTRKFLSLTVLMLTVLLLSMAAVAEAGWDEGVQAFKSGNYAQAAQEFKTVVDAQPEYAGGQFMLGRSYLSLKKNSDALTHLRKAYELDPGNVAYQLALGQAYLANARYGEGLQVLRKIDPASLPKQQQGNYQQMLAVALNKSGHSDEAIGALREVARSNPNSADAWFNYGAAAINADELDQGIQALEKAVSLNGNDPEKKQALASALVQKARRTRDPAQKKAVYAKGVTVAKALVSSNGTHESLLLLGELQLGAAQYDGAEATFQQAVSKKNNDYYSYYYLSQAQTSQSDWTNAEASARRALELARSESDKKRVWTQIGFINEKTKNFEEAKVAYRNAGDQGGLRRVEENQRIAKENEKIEEENREIDELKRQQEELERQLKELESGKPPLD